MGADRNKTGGTNKAAEKEHETCTIRTGNVCDQCIEMESCTSVVRTTKTADGNHSVVSDHNREPVVCLDVNTANFIQKARTIHGDAYDYSHVLYVNCNSPITIICPQHGKFSQRARTHLNGSGCRKCFNERTKARLTKTPSDWIAAFTKIHGQKYSYVLVDDRKVKVTCTVHNEMYMCDRANIVVGHGTKCCRNALMRTKHQTSVDEFIQRSHQVHGELYDYTRVVYTNTHTKVQIVCSLHGEFLQTPLNHLHGAGCPVCARIERAKSSIGGFTYRRFTNYPELKTIPGLLYVIRAHSITTNESFIKVGITTKDTVHDRLKFYSVFPYAYEIVGTVNGPLYDLFLVEQKAKKLLKSHQCKPSIPFNGYTECFNDSAELDLLQIVGINTEPQH